MEKRQIESECEGCIHWRPIRADGKDGVCRACHYFQDTGKTRYSMGAWGKCTVREEIKLHDFGKAN